MRIAGSGEVGRVAEIEAVIRRIDPDAQVRRDDETGIVHVLTRCDTLEITDAGARAGFEMTAMTG